MKVLDGALFLIGIISLARFTIPLISSSLPLFGRRLQPQEYAVWGGLLFMSSTLHQILPLFARNILPTSNEVLANDPRRPVIYFRSFEKELSKTGCSGILLPYLDKLRAQKGVYAFSTTPGNTFYGGRMHLRSVLGTSRSRFDEQMVFAHALSAIGPYVALGRPTESFRDMDLGAAKKYVSNDEWQGAVIDWLRKCAAVVMEAADSASLGWEIEQVVRWVPPTRVLVICPHTEDEYQAFVRAHEHRFPRRFPRLKPENRLLIFNNNWFPRELENINLNVTETLQPFFEQLRTGFAA
ncbi:MAG TPA: hypothetical protein VGW39_04505 [Chthoniobacterales bacterium]|nr:hypothetical protein [Chthoniobacterales bacterium]